MKKNATAKAFVMSVLSLVLCLSMLVGTTFAWFTDSVTSGVNKIVAGNLDIEMYHSATGPATTDAGNKVDTNTELFQIDLWEPGAVVYENFKIVNAGSLALKYVVRFNIEEVVKNYVVEKNGEEKKGTNRSLADALYIKITSGTVTAPRPAYTAEDGMKLSDFLNGANQYIDSDTLDAGADKDISVIVYWPHSGDDNLFNLKNGWYTSKTENGTKKDTKNKALYIQLPIMLVATQTPAEFDSFNDQYDATAEYPASSNAELAEKLENAEPGDVVQVAPGTYELPNTVAAGVTISGGGADSTVLKVPATPDGNNKKTGLIINQPGVTIRDAEIDRATFLTNDEYYGFIDIREGGTTLDGIKIEKVLFCTTSAVVIKSGVDAGETVRIVNSTLSGDYKTIDIVDGANGTIEIDNTEITGMYTFNVNSASSQELVIKVTNSKLHGWTSYGDIKSASFTDTEFSKGGSDFDFLRPYADTTLTNCTFDDGFKLGAGATGKTYTINNCTYNGTLLTAENVQGLLLEQSNPDIENLRGCTIIVDGKTVTLS